MYWTDLPSVNKIINIVFSAPPKIELINNIKIKTDLENDKILFSFDLVDGLPDNPPKKWLNQKFNRSQIRLCCLGISNFIVSSDVLENDKLAKIQINLAESSRSLVIMEDTFQVKVSCDFIGIEEFSVYYQE